jgi:hypothetical protein
VIRGGAARDGLVGNPAVRIRRVDAEGRVVQSGCYPTSFRISTSVGWNCQMNPKCLVPGSHDAAWLKADCEVGAVLVFGTQAVTPVPPRPIIFGVPEIMLGSRQRCARLGRRGKQRRPVLPGRPVSTLHCFCPKPSASWVVKLTEGIGPAPGGGG